MADKWSIWYEPPKGWDLAEPGWVQEGQKPVLYSSERNAKKDLKSWAVHPEVYEVRRYGRS